MLDDEFNAQEIPKVLDCGPSGNVVRACVGSRAQCAALAAGVVWRGAGPPCRRCPLPAGAASLWRGCGGGARAKRTARVCLTRTFPTASPCTQSLHPQCNLSEGGEYYKSTAQFL